MGDERAPITSADGTDVTKAVQLLYDIAHSSLDWGSGFLDNDEVETVVRLAVHMGWQVPVLPDRSEPMVTVAEKFPDHYQVDRVGVPATVTSYGYRYEAREEVYIKVRPRG